MSNGQNACRGLVEGRRCIDHRHRHIELGDEGRPLPTVGCQLLGIINKTATVPIRIEKTETKDGKVRWLPRSPLTHYVKHSLHS